MAGVLAVVVAALGLLWSGSADPVSVTSIRGDPVELFGDGLYRYDTLFVAANNRSSDLVVLLLAVPVLAGGIYWQRRGSVRGELILVGALGVLVYISATYALGGVAYNELFLLYVAFFSASLYAFVVTFARLARRAGSLFSSHIPRRLPGMFMLASGILTAAIWLVEPVTALVAGRPPVGLGTYATLFTSAFDVAVIMPAALIAGTLILRRRALGYVVAMALLLLEVALLPLITVATVVQLSLGITFTTGELVGPVAGFLLLAAFAVWVTAGLLRHTHRPAVSLDEQAGSGR